MSGSLADASAPSESQFKHYDRDAIRGDLQERVRFGRDFLRFSPEDGQTLNSVAKLIGPLVKPTVDAVYQQLFRFDYTARFFLKRNAGFEGDHAESLDRLTLDDPQIAFRKQILGGWVRKMFESDFESPATWAYFDKVAAMHTGLAAFKHRANKDPLVVDLQPMALLLGWVVDVVVKAVMEMPDDVADSTTKLAVISAFNKLVWLQNDLFVRWYAKSDDELAAATARTKAADASA
ncbi:protoglobin family protein [Rhodotorula paludigena]|uniref:protoglobin family protein n=1 Tax=Rhodotorula paludigena TaxID=86838 RepID=UPI00317AE40F